MAKVLSITKVPAQCPRCAGVGLIGFEECPDCLGRGLRTNRRSRQLHRRFVQQGSKKATAPQPVQLDAARERMRAAAIRAAIVSIVTDASDEVAEPECLVQYDAMRALATRLGLPFLFVQMAANAIMDPDNCPVLEADIKAYLDWRAGGPLVAPTASALSDARMTLHEEISRIDTEWQLQA